MLGYRPAELLGSNIIDHVHTDDVGEVRERLRRVSERPGGRGPVEVRFRRKDGSWCHLEGLGDNLLHDPDVRGIVVNSRDVTERKGAAGAVLESEQRFRQLFEQWVDALFVHDEEGRFVDCNSRACLLLGYSR